jgi:hypothetical protein
MATAMTMVSAGPIPREHTPNGRGSSSNVPANIFFYGGRTFFLDPRTRDNEQTVMFVGLLWWGQRAFPYYSYHINPTGREFFIPV